MSKVKRKHVETYLHGFLKANLTSNVLIEFDDWSHYYLNPNGSDRQVTFDGSGFKLGDTFYIRNTGSANTLTVTNTSTVIHIGDEYKFIYDGSVWSSYQVWDTMIEIDELSLQLSRSGGTTDQYLNVGGVPSNTAGYIMSAAGKITRISSSNKEVNTFTIEIRERTLGLLTSLTVTSSRTGYINLVSPVSFSAGAELQCKSTVTGGNKCTDPVVVMWYKFD